MKTVKILVIIKCDNYCEARHLRQDIREIFTDRDEIHNVKVSSGRAVSKSNDDVSSVVKDAIRELHPGIDI